MLRRILGKLNFERLASSTEWLVEIWALTRGLIILALVLVSILMNALDEFEYSPIVKIFESFTTNK